MGNYTSINDVINQYVSIALIGHEDEFDMDAIAREISEYDPESETFEIVHEDDFWEIAQEHVIA